MFESRDERKKSHENGAEYVQMIKCVHVTI